jgi:hypothetical protein
MSEWYCAVNGLTYGPFTETLLQDMAKEGRLTFDTLVWNGDPENAERGWQRALDTELAALLHQLPPPPPIAPPFPPAPKAETPKAGPSKETAPRNVEGAAEMTPAAKPEAKAETAAASAAVVAPRPATDAYAWWLVGFSYLLTLLFGTSGVVSYVMGSLPVESGFPRMPGGAMSIGVSLAVVVAACLFFVAKDSGNLRSAGKSAVRFGAVWAVIFTPVYFFKRVARAGSGWKIFYADLILKLFLYAAIGKVLISTL